MTDVTQQSCAAGELTEALQSREDLAKQQIGLKTCLNAIVTSTGSVINRPPTEYRDEVSDSTKEHRIIPFIFSQIQAYGIVFGDQTIQIIKDGSLVLREIVEAATYKWTASGSGTGEYYLELLAGGDPGLLETQYVLEDSVKMTRSTAGSLAASRWDFNDNDILSYDTFYVRLSDDADPDSEADGFLEIPYTIASPYTAGAQNTALDYAQSADVLYITGPDYMPYKLTRTADDAWTMTLIDFQDGPYLPFEDGDDDITFTPAAKTGSGIALEASVTIPHSPSVGLPIRIGYTNPLDPSIIEWGWAKVASIVDADSLTIDIQDRIGYEYLLNNEFKDGIDLWEDQSITPNNISYDITTNALQLNRDVGGVGGEAYAVQEITVNKYEKLVLEITVDDIDTDGVVELRIGTTLGGAEVLASQTISVAGTTSYTTLMKQPTTTTIYLRISTLGSPVDRQLKISRVSLMREDLSTTHWRMGAWDSDKGYPTHVALFEQSVWYGGSNIDNPDTIHKTKTGEYESFEFNTPTLSTDGMSITLASNEVNAIQSMTPYGELIAMTSKEEWRISGGDNNTITPTSVDAKSKSNTGSTNLKPIIAWKTLLFVGRNSDKVYALAYSADSDSFDPDDLTVLAPHLFENHTITEWAYQETPYSVIWCIRDDGVLLGLTYNQKQEIWAWHRHETQGLFESIAVVPESGANTTYFIVKRWKTESGARVVKRYIEKFVSRINDEDIYDYNFVDSGITLNIETGIVATQSITDIVFIGTKIQIRYTTGGTALQNNDYIYISNVAGTSEINQKTFRVSDSQNVGGGETGFYLKDKEGDDYIDASQYGEWVSGGEVRLGITEITELGHLLGKTVSILADGSYDEQTVVAESDTEPFGGKVTLDHASIVVHVGLPYTTEIETLPHDIVLSPLSTTQGKLKKLIKANIYFHKSRYAEISSASDGTMYEINFSDESSNDNPPPLFTGVKEKKVDDSYTKLTQTYIKCDKPLPMEIAGFVSEVDFSEKS